MFLISVWSEVEDEWTLRVQISRFHMQNYLESQLRTIKLNSADKSDESMSMFAATLSIRKVEALSFLDEYLHLKMSIH